MCVPIEYITNKILAFYFHLAMQHSVAYGVDAEHFYQAAKLQWANWWTNLQIKSSEAVHSVSNYAGTALVRLGDGIQAQPKSEGKCKEG